jgi:uncharacterized membrane protein
MAEHPDNQLRDDRLDHGERDPGRGDAGRGDAGQGDTVQVGGQTGAGGLHPKAQARPRFFARLLPEGLRTRFAGAFGHHGKRRFGERTTGFLLFWRSFKRRPAAAHPAHSRRARRTSLVLGLIYAIVTGVIGAAILHLVIILALPQFSDRDAFTRVLAEGEINQFHQIGASLDAAGLSRDDPFVDAAVCGFDLSDSPIRLVGANPGVPFWSLGVFNGRSDEVFSINDRTSADHSLDVVIGTPQQLTQLRKALPDGLSQSILVESAATDGFVVLRGMAPMQSIQPFVAEFLGKASCAPYEWRGRKGF